MLHRMSSGRFYGAGHSTLRSAHTEKVCSNPTGLDRIVAPDNTQPGQVPAPCRQRSLQRDAAGSSSQRGARPLRAGITHHPR
jgi:hypothetical protein